MIDVARLRQLITTGETLECEFKSDRRIMSDAEICEEVVAFANAEGGTLLIGVENNGSITGARPRHGATTDRLRLQAAIFNNTVPNINTRISIVADLAGTVIAIEVDPYPEPCATGSGKSVHRIIGPDGKPATFPYYPRDQRSRRIDLGLLDFSARPLEGTMLDSLDPLEFARLRQAITRLHGDTVLLELSDLALAKALQLISTENGAIIPNVAGLLLLG